MNGWRRLIKVRRGDSGELLNTYCTSITTLTSISSISGHGARKDRAAEWLIRHGFHLHRPTGCCDRFQRWASKCPITSTSRPRPEGLDVLPVRLPTRNSSLGLRIQVHNKCIYFEHQSSQLTLNSYGIFQGIFCSVFAAAEKMIRFEQTIIHLTHRSIHSHLLL